METPQPRHPGPASAPRRPTATGTTTTRVLRIEGCSDAASVWRSRRPARAPPVMAPIWTRRRWRRKPTIRRDRAAANTVEGGFGAIVALLQRNTAAQGSGRMLFQGFLEPDGRASGHEVRIGLDLQPAVHHVFLGDALVGRRQCEVPDVRARSRWPGTVVTRTAANKNHETRGRGRATTGHAEHPGNHRGPRSPTRGPRLWWPRQARACVGSGGLGASGSGKRRTSSAARSGQLLPQWWRWPPVERRRA